MKILFLLDNDNLNLELVRKEDKLIRLRQEITQGDYRDYRPRRIFVTTDMVKSTAEQQQLPF